MIILTLLVIVKYWPIRVTAKKLGASQSNNHSLPKKPFFGRHFKCQHLKAREVRWLVAHEETFLSS